MIVSCLEACGAIDQIELSEVVLLSSIWTFVFAGVAHLGSICIYFLFLQFIWPWHPTFQAIKCRPNARVSGFWLVVQVA